MIAARVLAPFYPPQACVTSRRKVSANAQAPPNPNLERARLEATDAFAELAAMSSKQSRNRKQKVRYAQERASGGSGTSGTFHRISNHVYNGSQLVTATNEKAYTSFAHPLTFSSVN